MDEFSANIFVFTKLRCGFLGNFDLLPKELLNEL
jgi:hypothetical protein